MVCSPSMSNLSHVAQSQSDNEKDSQNLQIDNIVNIPPQQISCVTQENEMQFYFDENLKVISYNL